MHRGGDRGLDLRRGRPDVAEEDVLAVLVLPERLGRQVDVHAPDERVGDDERRGGEVVRLHLGVDPRLEVAVAREHRRDDQLAVGDCRGDHLRQRAGVADARRAAVADGVEAELLEVRRQARALVVLRHDLRPGREARLHPRLAHQALFDRLLREQAGADHHLRVGGVRAARDRGDHDRAVLEVEAVAVHRHRHRLGSLRDDALGDVDRRLGLVDAVVRRVLLRRRVARGERLGHLLVVRVAVRDPERLERSEERVLRVGERDAVLRPPRSGDRRDDLAQVELDDLRVRPARAPGSCQSRFSLQYASTSSMRSSLRPVSRR